MIEFGIALKEAGAATIVAKFYDHCFGRLQSFPDMGWGNLRDGSSNRDMLETLHRRHGSNLCDILREVRLYTSEGMEDVWDNETEYLLSMEELRNEIPWLKDQIRIDHHGKFLALIINNDMKWDEALLKITFFRNLMCYNGRLYKDAISKGISRWHASVLSQSFTRSYTSTDTKVYIRNDEEYAWLCPLSTGEKSYRALLSLNGPSSSVYWQKEIFGGGNGGYYRDGDYESDDSLFNEDADDWGSDSNYYMMLCRTMCFVNDTKLPFIEGSEANGMINMSAGNNWKINNLYNGFKNWLNKEGFV
jgi:hypothetical protein